MTIKASKPFSTRPPRLKDLVNQHVMGDVWVRDTPFGPVTDSLVIAKKFRLTHGNILRSINKCKAELKNEAKYNRPKARLISAEILYRFFVLNTYVKGLTDMQIGAIKGYYRKHIKNL